MSARYAIEGFEENGVAVLPGFYDFEREIAPIREGARLIVELVARTHGVVAPVSTPEEAMSQGYLAVARANRAWGGEIYDAVKQIPAFVALVSNRRNVELFESIRRGAIAGVAAGGFGIRIDAPGEEKFRAPWHQEFPAQLRSLDGIVFWSPLLSVVPEMGPVEVAVGSHREGVVPVYEDDEGVGKTGAYALHLDGEQERIARYARVAPLTTPGDLLLMDFLTLHRSGQNVSDRPRWSMQFRLFNFNDPVGLRMAWRGAFAAGASIADLPPELLAEKAG
jgi:hypothetical protein